MKPILNLTIRRKWLDMIASGEKREEYRRADNRQVARAYARAMRHGVPLDPVVVLRAGYTMQSPALVVELADMTPRGAREVLHPEWGEERGVPRFVIELGRVLYAGEYSRARAWMEGQV